VREIRLTSPDSCTDSFSFLQIKPNKKYIVTTKVIGFKGHLYSGYFGIILLDKNNMALARRIRWLNDFSGKEKKYEIVFKTPSECTSISLIYRINNETPIKSLCHYIILPPEETSIKETDDDADEIYELSWQYDLPRFKDLPSEEEKRKNFDINFFERRVFSQNGEDGILEFIFDEIGITNKYFVEFGVDDGRVCNTKYLKEKKSWNGLMMDCKEDRPIYIKKEFVTAENINDLFEKYQVPHHFDLLSIDVDFNDFWLWKALENYSPRFVVIEFNSSIPPNKSKVVKYDPYAKWDKTNYFGASLLALEKLGSEKGYTLVGCDNTGTNAFFVKKELVKGRIKKTLEELYKPPKYGLVVNGKHIGHPPSNKKMIEI